MVYVILLYALFALVFPLNKAAVEGIQPIFFTGLRMFLAGVVLVGYSALVERRSIVRFSRKEWGSILLLMVFNIYLTNVLEIWGLQYLSSSKAAFMYNLSPFFSALISYIVFSERMTFWKWTGLLIGFAGTIPLFLQKSAAEEACGAFFAFSWGETALIGAALSTVIGWVTMRAWLSEGNCPILANGVSMLLSAPCIFFTSWFYEASWVPHVQMPLSTILFYLVSVTLISHIIAYNMYGVLLRRYTATYLTFAGFMSPLLVAIFGWFFLSEPITLSFIGSCVAVFAGLLLFYKEEVHMSVS